MDSGSDHSANFVWTTLNRDAEKTAAYQAGVGSELIAAGLLARLAASQLFGESPLDPVTLAGTVAVLCIAGLLASAVPAWRAVRVDPITALRNE